MCDDGEVRRRRGNGMMRMGVVTMMVMMGMGVMTMMAVMGMLVMVMMVMFSET